MDNVNTLLNSRVRDSIRPDHGLRGFNDPDMIMFGGGLPDPATHPVAELRGVFDDILKTDDKTALGYGYEIGNAGLRKVVAAQTSLKDVALSESNIVITNGCAGAIELTASALIEPGDVVVVEAATYPGALKCFRQMGAHIVTVPMDDGGLDPNGLADILQRVASEGRRVKLLYTISNCQNPTATTLDLERRQDILRHAARDDFLVLQDNTYGDIEFCDLPQDFISLDPLRSIHLGSFSKTIAPGLRVGWIAAREEIVAGVAQIRNDLGTSLLMQNVVERFCTDGLFAPHLNRLIDHYQRKRDIMISSLDRHCSDFAEWQVPDGGFFIWLKLKVATTRAALDAAAQEKVSFIPGSYFAAEPGELPNYLRLSYGEIPENQIDEGLRRLGKALSRLSPDEK